MKQTFILWKTLVHILWIINILKLNDQIIASYLINRFFFFVCKCNFFLLLLLTICLEAKLLCIQLRCSPNWHIWFSYCNTLWLQMCSSTYSSQPIHGVSIYFLRIWKSSRLMFKISSLLVNFEQSLSRKNRKWK